MRTAWEEREEEIRQTAEKRLRSNLFQKLRERGGVRLAGFRESEAFIIGFHV